MNELNKNEILWGFCYAIAFWWKIGWVALCLAPICAYWWAISGAGESKLWRRLAVPFLTSASSAILLQSYQPLWSIPTSFAVLSLGYGIPDFNDPNGSWLGRIAYKISCRNAEFITRSIIIILLIISNLPTILT